MNHWIAYDGNGMPTPETEVIECRLRDGTVSGPWPALEFDWAYGKIKGSDDASDVIFYRKVNQCSSEKESDRLKATDHLKAAAQIMDERGKQYDSEGGERSMDAAVRAFNAVTRRDQGSVNTKVATTAISASEGWLLLALLKAVRLFSRPGFHLDSAQDLIAYCALLAEEKEKQ